MLVQPGEKLHVVERRRFESDVRRHFVGEVDDVKDLAARMTGYTFVFNGAKNEYVRKPEKRTRIVSLSDGANLINILPRHAKIEDVSYVFQDRTLVVTDGQTFSLDINEFSAQR
jgi:hypothetical protein